MAKQQLKNNLATVIFIASDLWIAVHPSRVSAASSMVGAWVVEGRRMNNIRRWRILRCSRAFARKK
ncbi:hypothetical protein PanWU01x14_199260 [Parasponia andersonii]|uniref:Uncharacterized protein n=1 Tax=Parasponia andersonii TaxID=3476 RepID=A0A2P5BYU7_PARAD|nr:hypothetical protein PanWU01x14_199260 [Parasponia andersonii]